MWTAVWPHVPSNMRLVARRGLALMALSACACSAAPESLRIYGTVIVDVVVPEPIVMTGGTYLVSNDRGEPVRFGSLSPSSTTLHLLLPQDPDYVLSVNTLGRQQGKGVSLECGGFRKFDVIRLRETQLTLRLDCGELWPAPPTQPHPADPTCGIEALVVGPLRQLVGSSIAASVSAASDESRFRWFTSDSDVGHFGHPESDSVSHTEFNCDSAGEATLTVVISSGRCSDEASVRVSCVEWEPVDAGTY
jgi:hypothetical protein